MAEQDTITTADLAQAMEDRAGFYQFMSYVLLHEFTAEQIAQLKLLGELDSDSAAIAQEGAAIRRYLARSGPDPRTDLAVEYARIFLSAGVYDGLTAEPYESVFTSEDHLLMQDARDEVVAIYRAWDVDIDSGLHMPEDHLGLEFEFVALLAQRTAEALRAQGESEDFTAVAGLLEAQRDFLADHILNWIDQLIAKVEEFAQLPLYPALMRFARAYMVDDEQLLQEILAALA
ncbi:MAG: molecular chaperone TorD family protein [Eggerthellaceae bacterium]|nr:molecular chaperone TorD family protein [Eggerthellaceae bacterium]